jgi:predicted metal-dependent HD superfamily phosphohydrolase
MIENGTEDPEERSFSNKTSSSYIREYLDEKTGHKAKELYDRFVQFCQTVGIPEKVQLKWWTKLRDSYCTHWRGFFNLYHIYYILEHFDKFYDDDIYGAENRVLVELAIWFHRIVFLPLDIDYTYNVEQSYEIAENFIKDTDYRVVKIENLELVKALIMSVHRHRQKVEFEKDQHDKINKFFLDIILVFLGYEEEEYNKYKNAIGQGLLWSGKKLQQVELQGAFTITPEFILKRKVILKRLIDRERIYLTDRLYEEFEEKARKNLQRELDE